MKFDFNGNSFYIDGLLKERLDKYIIPELSKKDKDAVMVIDGKERSGKSVFGMILGAYVASQLKSSFNLSNVCMTPIEFRNKIETSDKNEVVIYDEAHRGMGSSRALSEINNILKDLMMEMGQRNLFVIVILPTFFLLERYVALFRARGLFHIYERRGYSGKRFWRYYNEQKKKQLYMKGKKEFNYNCIKNPIFKGVTLNQYTLDEKEYRKKKAQSFKQTKRITRDEKSVEQINLILYAYYNDMGFENATEMYKALKVYDDKKILMKKSSFYERFKKIFPKSQKNL